MKKLLLALCTFISIGLWSGLASAQCNGVFGANTACGTVAGGIPGQIPFSAFVLSPGGSSGQVQVNNGAGGFGGLTNAQLTALVQQFSASLSGTVPASGGGAINFLRADGTWQPFNYSTPEQFSAVCDGSTDDAIPLQNWLNSVRDRGLAMMTAAELVNGCATTAPLLLQASTNTAPVSGPVFVGRIKLIGLGNLGATATATGTTTSITLSAVSGIVHIGDTIIGGGTANNTHIVSQSSGPTGGNGVYVTDQSNTISGGVGIISDVLRIWNPTTVATPQNFYYPQFDTLELNSTGNANCLSLRGYWGTIARINMFAPGCHAGDGVQFPNYISSGIPDPYESNPNLGDVTCIGCSNYVVNNLIGIGATPRINNLRGTVVSSFTTGLGAIYGSGSEIVSNAIAYAGLGWAVTVAFPPVGGGSIQTNPHEVYMRGAGDIDCAQNGVWVAAAQVATIEGHRMNLEPPASCNGVNQWPLVAYAFGGGGGLVSNVTVRPYITIRPGYVIASGTMFDFKNDANIANLVVDSTVSDQTGTFAGTAFASIYKNINAAATIRIIQNGIVVYDTITPGPNVQKLTSIGANQTYTTPANTRWLEIEGVGPGGGGGAAATNNGAAGLTGTCWNTSGTACTSPVLLANSGAGGATASGGPLGGTASGGNVYNTIGGDGFAFNLLGASQAVGGQGGNSCRSGGGRGGVAAGGAGSNGGGGGGGGQASTTGGAGGGGGGCFKHIILNPAASYVYTIPAGGLGGAAGVAAGAAGGQGEIDVTAHFTN